MDRMVKTLQNARVIDLSDLPAGMYIVKVKTKDFEKNQLLCITVKPGDEPGFVIFATE
jgi:hypothetical protein